jgi:uncharacterized membrane protein YkvA (DUF1232 family)
MADLDAARAVGREVRTFVPDVVAMMRGVMADPRLPRSAKMQAAAALAYLVSPKNRLTNLVPVLGQLDDLAIVALAFRRLMLAAGEDLPREHWRGSDRAFQLLLERLDGTRLATRHLTEDPVCSGIRRGHLRSPLAAARPDGRPGGRRRGRGSRVTGWPDRGPGCRWPGCRWTGWREAGTGLAGACRSRHADRGTC